MARPSRGRARGGRPSPRVLADDDADDEPPPFVDLYAALELNKGASSGAIKKAYRALALRWHPDKNAGDAEAHARFQDISKAYAVLSDPKKRAYYDTTGDVEDIDVSADDFVHTFVVMMDELLGGGTIEDMLEGLGDADFASMPPFPFPKHLFPPDTFPENMRFSDEFHVPPAVAELVEREGPEALQRLVAKHRARGERSDTKGRRGARFDDDDDDDDDSSRSSEWESDDDATRDAAWGRDRGAGTRAGERQRRGGFEKRSGDADASSSDDDDLGDPELEAMLRSMPPEMFEQFLREDARGGGEAGEEAAALVALLEEMGGLGPGGSGLPPELAGLLGRASGGGGGGGGGRFGDARSSPGGAASPAGPGEWGGGGGGAAPRRGRPRHAGQSAFRRGKKGGSPGTRPAAAANAGAGDPVAPGEKKTGHASPFSEPPGGPGSATSGSRTEKNRRKKARKKEKEKLASERCETFPHPGSERAGEGPAGSGEQAPRTDPVGPTAWAPDAFFSRAAATSTATEPAFAPDREVSRRWVAAAKSGDVATLRGILRDAKAAASGALGKASAAASAALSLFSYRSPGIGHTALHWSASRGADALEATAWLLAASEECVHDYSNARNGEGATPLHAAAGIGSTEALAALAAAGADPRAEDDAGETAADVAARRGHASFAAACRDGEAAFEVFVRGRGRAETTREPPVGATKPNAAAESDSSDDEASRAARLAAMSAEAKRKGNAAFAAGEFAKAVKQFTMAIRMDKTNHVLFSNRSAAHAGLGKYEDALADAERCVRMSPKWGKGYGRKGAALTGLGQGGEAVKAYLAGLAVEPESEALRAGLAEAKAAIRQAQDRYKDMWGKDAPAGLAAEEP